MNYRGFSIRENRKTGQWQAITRAALHWEDGLSAPDRFALKTKIDNYRDNERSDPWKLPRVQRPRSVGAAFSRIHRPAATRI